MLAAIVQGSGRWSLARDGLGPHHVDDIEPSSDFRAKAAALIRQARESGRPVVIAQNGRSPAVLMDVKSDQDLLDELAVLRDLGKARSELASGAGVPQAEAMARLRARVARK